MNKKTLLLFLFILTNCILFAKQVDVNYAEKVASNFLAGKIKVRSNTGLSLKLVHTAKSESKLRSTGEETAYFYIFNIGNNNGFVIVSADDINRPILGYSFKGHFDMERIPDSLKDWMKNVELNMAHAISNGLEQPEIVKKKWNTYSSNPSDSGPGGSGGEGQQGSGDFLIKSTWDQDEPFENSLPVLESGIQRPAAGCVAIAIGQIMKYYNYPTRGLKPTEAYWSKKYPSTISTFIPSIDLTKHIYDWNNILLEYKYKYIQNPDGTVNRYPNYTQYQAKAVADLIFHIGASSKMSYGNSSSAPTIYAARALVEYFGYDNAINVIKRRYYSDQEWINIIKNEINNRRPVYVEGWTESGSGHAFICDGYDPDGLFHINLGWGGYVDGYFSIDDPLRYSLDQQIIINIKPGNGTRNFEDTTLSLDESISNNPEISIFPNPVKDVLNITSLKGDIKQIILMDLMGKVVLVEDINESEKSIPVQHLPQNMYILKVNTSKGQSIFKINKE